MVRRGGSPLIIIISCGKRKLEGRAKAKDIYIGSLYHQKLEYVRTLYPNHEFYIISAKHGLIHQDVVISSYDRVLPSASEDYQKWLDLVTEQLQAFDSEEEALFLGGVRYYAPVDEYFTGVKYAPLIGKSLGGGKAYLHNSVISHHRKKQKSLFSNKSKTKGD